VRRGRSEVLRLMTVSPQVIFQSNGELRDWAVALADLITSARAMISGNWSQCRWTGRCRTARQV